MADYRVVVAERPDSFMDQRYQALVHTENLLWNFGCGHLHKTEAAAQRCIPRVREAWQGWQEAERTVVQLLPHIVIEFKVTIGNRTMTKRMSPADFWKEVVA